MNEPVIMEPEDFGQLGFKALAAEGFEDTSSSCAAKRAIATVLRRSARRSS